MADYLLRAVAMAGQVRALAAVTTELVREAVNRHSASPTAAAALGRSMTAAALLGANLKDRQSLTLRLSGDGPLRGVIADADSTGAIRGYVKNPEVDLELNDQGKLDVGGAVGGNGYLYLTWDLGIGEPYTGSSPIVSGEIAEDVAHYLTTSEQIPSAVALGVLVDNKGVRASGGYIVQALPGASEEVARMLEKNTQGLGAVSWALDASMTAEDILRRLLEGMEYKIVGGHELRFECRCSRARALGILASLGRKDLINMVQEDDGAEMRCHFCNEVYRFDGGEIERLLGEQGGSCQQH